MSRVKLTSVFLLSIVLVIFNSCNIEPFEGDIPEQETQASSCSEAVQNTATAATNFVTVSPADSNYAELCSAYKKALEDQMSLCGDEDGIFQTLIDALECDVDGTGTVADGHAFMTANINGEQYNDMKPNGYLFFGGATSVNGFFTRSDDDYLVLQGNSGYKMPTLIDVTDREINLKIPSINWKEGTYVLYDELNDVFEGVCYYTFFGIDNANDIYAVDQVGEIIITKFSLEERVIEGTFEFEYKLVNEIDDSEEGPFKVTGTFDYSLDDEFFD